MSYGSDRVEVLSAVQRRRRYSVDQKLAVLQEAAQPGATISYVARRHGIAPSLIFAWRKRMSDGGKEAMRADDEVVAKAEVVALQKQIRELQRVLGKKTLENEILREAVKIAHEKKSSSRGCRRCPKTIRREACCLGPGRVPIAAQPAPEGTGQVALELPQARE